MDNIFPSPLFTLQQSDDDFELFLPAFTTTNTISNDPCFVSQQDYNTLPLLNNQYVIKFDHPPLTAEASRRKGKKQPEPSAASSGGDNNEKQRRSHREIERQRRQEMATLYASLRNELPHEYLRGKRSISDHIREAIRYIEHKQNRIRELEDKRDKLKRVATSTDVTTDPISIIGSSQSIMVKMQPSIDGLEISINCGPSNLGSRVSSVLQLLQDEGLNLVSCVCSTVDGSLLHSIRAEVSSETSFDLEMLRQKVTDKIRLTSSTI